MCEEIKMYGHEISPVQIEINEYFNSYMNMLAEYREDPSRENETDEMLNMYYDAYNNYSPDLNSIPQLDLYVMRYGTANFFEYFVMYDIALQKLASKTKIAAVSFGCGSKIDELSLAFAAQNYNIPPEQLLYFGLDILDWKRKFVVMNKYIGGTVFVNESLECFFDEGAKYYKLCRMFIFAKILSEQFDTERLEENIVRAMQSYPYDDVIVCFSIRNKNCFSDLEASDRIIRAFVRGMGGIDNCCVDCGYNMEGTSSQRKIRASLEHIERTLDIDGTEVRVDPIIFNDNKPEAFSQYTSKPFFLVHPLFQKNSKVDSYFKSLRDKGYTSPNGENLYPSANVDPMCFQVIKIKRCLADDGLENPEI